MFTKGKWATRELFNGFGESIYLVESGRLLITKLYSKDNAQLIASALICMRL